MNTRNKINVITHRIKGEVMKFYRFFLITIILYLTFEKTQASEHPEWFSGEENTSTISKTDLSPESTIVYLTRIIEKESDYNAQLNTFIKDFERQQITNLKNSRSWVWFRMFRFINFR